MGWRSWNCYVRRLPSPHAARRTAYHLLPRAWQGGGVTQAKMTATMDAMADRSRRVDGKPQSLLDLGYNNCGLDDNWQQCKAGVNGSFHDEHGEPLINTKTFPNMSAMTEHGHRLGLRVGWCACTATASALDLPINRRPDRCLHAP